MTLKDEYDLQKETIRRLCENQSRVRELLHAKTRDVEHLERSVARQRHEISDMCADNIALRQELFVLKQLLRDRT